MRDINNVNQKNRSNQSHVYDAMLQQLESGLKLSDDDDSDSDNDNNRNYERNTKNNHIDIFNSKTHKMAHSQVIAYDNLDNSTYYNNTNQMDLTSLHEEGNRKIMMMKMMKGNYVETQKVMYRKGNEVNEK